MVTPEAALHLNNQKEFRRPLAEFPEGIWNDRFTSIALDKQVYDVHAEEIERLKEEVKFMLIATDKETREKIKLIDIIERLGICYHFEKEIEQLLEESLNKNANLEEYSRYDLDATALQFRISRQNGFNISCGVFYPFLDGNGKFKESLSIDTRGLLNLYEAAHLRTHQDIILEEAISFAATHLKSWAQQTASNSLAKQVNHALEQAIHKGNPRIEACHYISVYEENEDKNHLLLRLAKLDYHFLQMLHRQELNEILRWAKDWEIVSNFPFSRNRVVECYFWALGVFIEPQHSLGRIIFTKTCVYLTVADDIYDAYGTIDELKAFRDTLESYALQEQFRLRLLIGIIDFFKMY